MEWGVILTGLHNLGTHKEEEMVYILVSFLSLKTIITVFPPLKKNHILKIKYIKIINMKVSNTEKHTKRTKITENITGGRGNIIIW